MFKRIMINGAAVFCASLALQPTAPAEAGRAVIDTTLITCFFSSSNLGAIPEDGAIEMVINGGRPDLVTPSEIGPIFCDNEMDPSLNFYQPELMDKFSINLFGKTYDTAFINENGIVSFGAPITDDPDTTSILDLLTPALAPMFGDVAPHDLNVAFGWDPFSAPSFWITYLASNELDGDPQNWVQFAIIKDEDGAEGDFDLIMNYVYAGWDPFRAGFTDGKGGGVEFPGSGVPGAYLGSDDPDNMIPVPCAPASIICLPGFDYLNVEPGRTGFYRIAFRGGYPQDIGDFDGDNDGVQSGDDNCPTIYNPGQKDRDNDGFGDACVPPYTIRRGVTVGANPVIGYGVWLGRGVVIGNHAKIGGYTKIGRRTTIGDDVSIGKAVFIGGRADIGDHVKIGKFSLIRRGVRICDGAKIGKWVTIGRNRLIDTGETVNDGARLRGSNTPPGECSGADD